MTYEPTNAEYVRAATEAGFYEHELNPSLRDFANRIAYDASQKKQAEFQAEGWRQCAKGQKTSQFCGQLEEAVKAENESVLAVAKELIYQSHIQHEEAVKAEREARKAAQIENEQLKAERNRAGVEMRNAVSKAVREERQRQRDKIEAHIRRTTMSVYGTQSECKAARDVLQRLLDDDE